MTLNKIKLEKINVIKNSKGDILKYLSNDNSFFKKFGETYFTEIKHNEKKGWNYHKKCQSLLTVPVGRVEFTFAENVNKKKKTIIIGRKNHSMIILPPNIWFNFKSLYKTSCCKYFE